MTSLARKGKAASNRCLALEGDKVGGITVLGAGETKRKPGSDAACACLNFNCLDVGGVGGGDGFVFEHPNNTAVESNVGLEVSKDGVEDPRVGRSLATADGPSASSGGASSRSVSPEAVPGTHALSALNLVVATPRAGNAVRAAVADAAKGASDSNSSDTLPDAAGSARSRWIDKAVSSQGVAALVTAAT
mmetsp:Transcript_7952/g.21928  ORF Transcript_7952/g.21928 Transcript_7952/m.21928 type:complete len:190 (-) Transcript_7952:350-919(-)